MLDGEDKIIEHAVRGKASAFGSLYDYYQPKIYRFVLIKVGRREEAEDLTHQVFLSAWQNIRTYQNLGYPFSSWLYQIARNQIIDHYRTRKHEARLDYLDPDILTGPADPEFTMEDAMEMERVHRALQELKPEYQDIVIMRFIEELSVKETAHALLKSEGAIKLMQHRALKELKTLLREPHGAQ